MLITPKKYFYLYTPLTTLFQKIKGAMILTQSRNFYFVFSMKLTRFQQVDFKSYEINANLRQICKFSGKTQEY